MRNHLIIILATIVLLAGTAAEAKYSGGTGEPNDPYQIGDVNDLLALAADTNDYGKCFILTADVNMQGQVFTTAIIAPDISSEDYFQGIAFTGTFDGNGHKITHFTINGGSNWYLGLFGFIDVGGSVKNLGLENCSVSSVSGSSCVGGLVGYSIGSISNCYSAAAFSGFHMVGGLVGGNWGTISHCYSTGTVNGTWDVGGLVGVGMGNISECYSTASVSGSFSSSREIGGLAGVNGGSISNCYSTGAVSGSSDSYDVGGLVGYKVAGSISNCYSTGSVSGSYDVGGLVGYIIHNNSTITNSYSTGSVSGNNNVGGLVGLNYYNSSISKCYSTGPVSGVSNVGGLVGINDSGSVVDSFWDTQVSGQTTSAGGTGKMTAEMKKMSTFTDSGWDFIEIWGIGENQTYPYLRTEPAGDLNHDKKVDFADLAILALHWLEGTGP